MTIASCGIDMLNQAVLCLARRHVDILRMLSGASPTEHRLRGAGPPDSCWRADYIALVRAFLSNS
jgi:hypothetical protein